ncbi:Asp-tRNA(Asn)/Glu-tRNA(Gln) amidotransferase subunit GatC [bacterium]|nr:Asp-tRNA(Asn)/Glu-tRNA(Gln) amidotransferase subunit GatC [bacterium]
MSSITELKKIAALAYLDTNTEHSKHLLTDVNNIMQYIEQLCEINTTGIEPLSHPFDLHQRLRVDTVTDTNCAVELEKMAPLFVDGLFLVPKVIDTGK